MILNNQMVLYVRWFEPGPLHYLIGDFNIHLLLLLQSRRKILQLPFEPLHFSSQHHRIFLDSPNLLRFDLIPGRLKVEAERILQIALLLADRTVSLVRARAVLEPLLQTRDSEKSIRR